MVEDGEFTTLITNQTGYDVLGFEVSFSATINGEYRKEMTSVGPINAAAQVRLYPGWSVREEDKVDNVYVHVTTLLRPDAL